MPESCTTIGDYAFFSFSDKEILIVIRNGSCSIGTNITGYRIATLYSAEPSTAKTYAEGNTYVTFMVLDATGCEAGTHQLSKVTTLAPACETDGKEKQICLNCDYETAETTVAKLGHQIGATKNICDRCEQIVNADTMPYVTLQQSVTIKKADFTENGKTFTEILYGFSLEKPGTYEVSISDESLWGNQVELVRGPENGSKYGRKWITGKKVVLKEGEALWLSAIDYSSVYGVEIGISCKHADTEDKTTPAKCEEDGKVETVCTSCGELISTTPIPKTGHSFGTNEPKCTVCDTPNPNYKQTDPQTVRLGKMTLSASKVTYSGKEMKPSVTVTDTNGKTVDAANYTVTYSDNTNVGEASVTVTGKNGCTGTLTAGFQIVPKATKVAKVTAKKKALTIKWKKQTKQTSGYELQLSTKKNFKGAKKVTVKKNKTTSVTVVK